MSLSKRLYRESALERLASPEQLDQQLTVTSPRGWVALVGLWALLAMIVAWSLLGSVPTREEGPGIIVVGGGLKVVVSPGTGRLSDIRVNTDEEVALDQIVAHIDQPDLEIELAETRRQLAEMSRQHEQLDALDAEEERRQADLSQVETDRLRKIIVFAGERVARLKARRAIVEKLVTREMMTEIDLHDIDEQVETATLEGEKSALDIAQLEARDSNAAFQRQRDRMKRALDLEALQGKITMLQSRFDHESQVRSPIAGTVVEVRAALHNAVKTGDPLFLIEPAESAAEELEAILYVSAATGKRIKEGMSVHISPTTFRREEYGSMVGEISYVSPVPTTKLRMVAVLADQDLVETFTREIVTPLETRVRLVGDTATFSGYRWTSSEGPQARVTVGTLCRGSVTVKRQRPFELLVPYLVKKLGVD